MKRSIAANAATIVAVVTTVLCAGVPALHAQWVEDGTALCLESGEQRRPYLVALDDGGAIVIWEDERSGDWEIFAQRIDARGVAQWTSGGVAVCTVTGDQMFVRAVSDALGGVIVAWDDYRSGSGDIYAQRIDGSGNRQWSTPGVAICAASGSQVGTQIAADGSGNAIIAWQGGTAGDRDLYAQKISWTGALQWGPDGICVCADGADQYACEISPDLQGGAYVVWVDARGGTADIYGQRVGSDGSLQWTSGGVAICTESGSQNLLRMITDSWGKAILCWNDLRVTTSDIYAQKLDRNGTAEWASQGVVVCAAAGPQLPYSLIHDGAGGAIIGWHDLRGTDYDIYAQRIDAWGNALWTADGVAVYAGGGDQTSPDLAADGVGGAVIVWRDQRGLTYDIYAQRIDGAGMLLWNADGVPVCTAANDQSYPKIVTDGAGGAIVAWFDDRAGVFDIYAQRVERNGHWGYPAPVITSITDSELDEGGYVKVDWNASRIDPLPDGLIDYYTIWRAIEPAAAAKLIEEGALVFGDSPADSPAPLFISERLPRLNARATSIRIEKLGGAVYYWELIDSNDAWHAHNYRVFESTLFDSTATSDGYHFFQIIAHGYDPEEYWISLPDSGYSVDNIPPGAPSGLACEARLEPEGLSITWDPNPEADLSHYAVYRGPGPDFTPAPGSLLATTELEGFFDGEWRAGDGSCYRISAVDAHGNEGPPALLKLGGVTGARPESAPAISYLGNNYPNPFNPVTTIPYGLCGPRRVMLTVYDAAGRRVRVLVQGNGPEGHHTATWNGTDAKGQAVASGVYFIRLQAPGFDKSRTVILLR